MAKPPEKNELSYEAGVERILQMVEQKLSDAELVVVGIIGATAHVGKTYLAKDLYGRLSELGIPTVFYKSDEPAQVSSRNLTRLNDIKEQYGKQQGVVVLEQLGWGAHDFSAENQERADLRMSVLKKRINEDVGGRKHVKILVGIGGKNMAPIPPENIKIVDVLIRNEFASSKGKII